ncbi:hypothetical protein ABZ942_19240 [Nocardia sp. NPDC046473]
MTVIVVGAWPADNARISMPDSRDAMSASNVSLALSMPCALT